MTNLLVSEIFGPTFQGEGPDIGKPTLFLRLGGCPVQCTWCDTKYTWDTQQYDLKVELQTMSIEKVQNELTKLVSKYGTSRLVISGGEPMTQQRAIRDCFRPQTLFESIEIETSGVVSPKDFVYPGWRTDGFVFNVSPKLRHAGAKVPYNIDTLTFYREIDSRFKFVVGRLHDLEEVADIVNQCEIPNNRVWIMPLATERHDLVVSQQIVEQVVLNRWNLTTRLHVLIYGNRRGV